MVKGFVGAVLGGILGAAIWAAIGFYGHREIGIVAWGIGALVGIGAVTLNGRAGGLQMGVMAAVVAAASVAGGKYLTVYFAISKEAASISPLTADEAKIGLAHLVAQQYQEEGKTLSWPAGVTPESAEYPQNFPSDVWQEAEKRWTAMGADAQTALLAELNADRNDEIAAAMATATTDIFLQSFDAFDLLWFGLALVTAFQIAAGSIGKNEPGT